LTLNPIKSPVLAMVFFPFFVLGQVFLADYLEVQMKNRRAVSSTGSPCSSSRRTSCNQRSSPSSRPSSSLRRDPLYGVLQLI
jgi:hypothetical protein